VQNTTQIYGGKWGTRIERRKRDKSKNKFKAQEVRKQVQIFVLDHAIGNI
jgi:hypothetical protein